MDIFRQYLFLIPVIVMGLSELTKMAVEYFRTGHWHAAFLRPGGMPSSHSAFVTSLMMIVYRKLGAESAEFAIAFGLAAVVWYDALNVRREIGLQAEMLNRLQHWEKLRERMGHSLKELIAGIAFGAIVTQIGIYLS